MIFLGGGGGGGGGNAKETVSRILISRPGFLESRLALIEDKISLIAEYILSHD